MVIRLQLKKLQKAQALVQTTITQKSLLLLELQSMTGYLNFVSIAVSLERTFLRSLSNMGLYFPAGSKHQERCRSGDAHKDLVWLDAALAHPPQTSIHSPKREIISTWTDAASTNGFGAFCIGHLKPISQLDTAFYSTTVKGYPENATY